MSNLDSTPAEVNAATPARYRSKVLWVSSLVSSLIMLDSNIVAVSLPSIGRAIGAEFKDIEWVISAYVLTYAALLLAAGNYADLRGRRHSMVVGLGIFAVASLACGLATSSGLLNLSRAAQGVGGAMLLTSSLAVLSHEFSGAQRAQAFAFWGASLGTALAIGPIVGGAVTDFFGWRWIFLINVPICAALIRATFRTIEESRDPHARRLDFRGIVSFSAGLGFLIWALIDGNEAGWTSVWVLSRILLAAVSLISFYRLEIPQERPMVDFGLFGLPAFVGAVIAMLGYGATAQVLIFFLPLYLQNAHGFSPLMAGIGMSPFALPMVLAPSIVGRLGERYSGRTLLTVGLTITCLGNVLLSAAAWSGVSYALFLIPMLVAGCGAGLLNGQTVKVLGNSVPAARAGMASGLASTTRFIGILVSVAGLGAILSAVVSKLFVSQSRVLGLTEQTALAAVKKISAGNIMQALDGVAENLRPQLAAIAQGAFGHGFAAAALVAAAVSAASAAATFVLLRNSPARTEGLKAPTPCLAIDCRHPI
jgi:EmrB/QacA subfamily drug resistance transporter